MACRFSTDEIRPTGRSAQGIKAIKLKPLDSIADFDIIDKDRAGIDFISLSLLSWIYLMKLIRFVTSCCNYRQRIWKACWSASFSLKVKKYTRRQSDQVQVECWYRSVTVLSRL